MNKIKFGTDGWRGVIGEEYTDQNVSIVAHAVARTFQLKPKTKVFVGYDHRFQAKRFAQLTASILNQYSISPQLLSRPVTSPVLSFITWKEKCPFGVMITASHNPSQYLGFKVKGSFGGSIPTETIQKIEEKLLQIQSNGSLKSNFISPVEYPEKDETLFESYFSHLKTHIDTSFFRKKKIPVIYDFLYGSGSYFCHTFFRSFDHSLQIDSIHDSIDPLFGGIHPEPIETYLSDLKKQVKTSRAHCGLALDGDADRLGVVDENGTYLTPQQVFALLLYYLLSEKKLKGSVVCAVNLGYLSERIAKDFNCPFQEVPVGFKHVAEQMLIQDVLMGGEESGGYAFSKTKSSTVRGTIPPERDGLFSSLLFIEMISAIQQPVSQILKDLQKRYGQSVYLRRDIPLVQPILDAKGFVQQVESKLPSEWLGKKIQETKKIDGLKIVLEDGSWVLLRPSGTEPLLRTYAESPQIQFTQKSLDKIFSLLPTSLKDK